MFFAKEHHMDTLFREEGGTFTNREYLESLVTRVETSFSEPLIQSGKVGLRAPNDNLALNNLSLREQVSLYRETLAEIEETNTYLNQCDFLEVPMGEVNVDYIPDAMFKSYFGSIYHKSDMPITVGEYSQVYLNNLHETLSKLKQATEFDYSMIHVSDADDVLHVVTLLKEQNISLFSELLDGVYPIYDYSAKLIIMHCILKYYELVGNMDIQLQLKYEYFLVNYVYDTVIKEVQDEIN